jgi:hypothetical protein
MPVPQHLGCQFWQACDKVRGLAYGRLTATATAMWSLRCNGVPVPLPLGRALVTFASLSVVLGGLCHRRRRPRLFPLAESPQMPLPDCSHPVLLLVLEGGRI